MQLVASQAQRRLRQYAYGLSIYLAIGISVLLAMITTACVADSGIYLTVENRLPSDVTIFYQPVFEGGRTSPTSLGTASAGETVKLPGVIIRGGLGGVPKIVLKAQDLSGITVWQRSWTGKEFLKLEEVGWKIVVSS